jgi:hypothetical protein
VTGVIRNAQCIALLLLLAGAVPAAAQRTAQSAVTLQATGSFPNNGSFVGTMTINRFEERGNQIVAIGVVQGTLTRANRVIGTAVAGEVAWPMSVSRPSRRPVSLLRSDALHDLAGRIEELDRCRAVC